jgi:hypothetical protein
MPYMLSAGRLFDVVTIDQRTGLETYDQLVRRELPLGPVMVDHKARRVGFFLNSRCQEAFAHFLAQETDSPPAFRYLSLDSVVVVPGPMPLPSDRYQWLRAPLRRPEANPLRPVALATMLVAAAELLARVDRYGEQYPSPVTASAAVPERTPADAG